MSPLHTIHGTHLSFVGSHQLCASHSEAVHKEHVVHSSIITIQAFVVVVIVVVADVVVFSNDMLLSSMFYLILYANLNQLDEITNQVLSTANFSRYSSKSGESWYGTSHYALLASHW
uniref:Uncharacterized protein n=1 Tax=Glossina pallidipes TaxID=7398 RepID=A0A1B0A8I0_GLOPL